MTCKMTMNSYTNIKMETGQPTMRSCAATYPILLGFSIHLLVIEWLQKTWRRMCFSNCTIILRDFAFNQHSQTISTGSMLTLQIPGLNGINGKPCSTWTRHRIGESGILNWNRNGPGKNCGMRWQNSLTNSGLWSWCVSHRNFPIRISQRSPVCLKGPPRWIFTMQSLP